MSRAGLIVRFNDGTIRRGIYNGTVDTVWPPLFGDANTAWDEWDEYYWDEYYWDEYYRNDEDDPTQQCDCAPQQVTVYSDYGGGFWWRGEACMHRVHGPFDPWDEALIHDGWPFDKREVG